MTSATSRVTLAFITIAGTSPLVAQQDHRDAMVVDASGVYVRAASRPVQSPIDGGVSSALSPRGLRWSWSSPTTAEWIARSVSVGQRGTLAWVGHTLNGKKLSLSATTDNPTAAPKPIFEVSYSNDMVVKAADASAVAVVAPSKGGVLEFRRAYANTVVHSITHATKRSSRVEVAISANGRYFAAGYTTTVDGSDVYVYDALSAIPKTPIAKLNVPTTGKNTFNAFRQFDLSGDGSTVLLATHTENFVFDVKTGKQLFKDSSTVSHDAHAISADGKVWGRGGFDIGAWVHDGTTYKRVLSGKGTGNMSFPVWTACGLSADGKTFVVAAYDARNVKNFEISCFNLGLTTTKSLWSYSNTGGGVRQDVPSAVSVSADGKIIAVGSWGAQSSGHPEVLIFDRDKGSTPIGTIDTPGSVFDLDLSGNGRFVVAGTKKVHANVFGRGGIAYSYDLGGRSFWREGTASLTRSIKLSVDGKVADPVLLALSTSPIPPVAIPGIGGFLAIHPGKFLTAPVALGTVPVGGTLSVTFPVGTSAAAVGLEVHCQCARVGASPSFTNALVIPITP
jgi:hypothetical protein